MRSTGVVAGRPPSANGEAHERDHAAGFSLSGVEAREGAPGVVPCDSALGIVEHRGRDRRALATDLGLRMRLGEQVVEPVWVPVGSDVRGDE